MNENVHELVVTAFEVEQDGVVLVCLNETDQQTKVSGLQRILFTDKAVKGQTRYVDAAIKFLMLRGLAYSLAVFLASTWIEQDNPTSR